jgi:hypothetical protein
VSLSLYYRSVRECPPPTIAPMCASLTCVIACRVISKLINEDLTIKAIGLYVFRRRRRLALQANKELNTA